MSWSVTRRSFLRGIAGAAVVGPIGGSRIRAGAQGAAASFGADGRRSPTSAPSPPPRVPCGGRRRGYDEDRPGQAAFPTCGLSGLAGDAREGKDQHRSVNISTPDHMHADHDGGMSWAGGVRPEAAGPDDPRARILALKARQANLVTQMGIQIPCTRPNSSPSTDSRGRRRQDPRSPHVLRQGLGRHHPIPAGADPVPETSTGTTGSGSASRAPTRPRSTTRATGGSASATAPGRSATWAATSSRRRSAASASRLPRQVTSHGPAPVHGSWPVQSKIHFVFGATPYTAGETLDFWWYDGSERPPQAVIDAVGGKLPSSGSVMSAPAARSSCPTSTTPRCTRRRSSSIGKSRRVCRGTTTTSFWTPS